MNRSDSKSGFCFAHSHQLIVRLTLTPGVEASMEYQAMARVVGLMPPFCEVAYAVWGRA